MSWFDTSGFASLAKTALKEAQKTIDKALDIKDEDQKKPAIQSVDNPSDFFDTWEIENKKHKQEIKLSISEKQQASSIWGSFTGSFFDSTKDNMTAIAAKQIEAFNSSTENIESIEKLQSSLVTSKSFPESLSDNIESKSSIDCVIVQSTTEPDLASVISKSESSEEFISQASTNENSSEKKSNSSISQELSSKTNYANSSAKNSESNKPSSVESVEINKKNDTFSNTKEHSAKHSLNRLSIVSAESDKRSSESVEILSSRSATNTECTNSPDSDLNSLSTSIDIKVNSESVEVLPDSLLTSPSSVEVLGEWKSDESPYLSPMDEKLIESSITPLPCEVTDFSYYNEAFNDAESSTSTLEGSQLSGARPKDTSAENVEVIGDGGNVMEEPILVEESCNSVLESTFMANNETVPQQNSWQLQESCTEIKQIMSVSSDSDYQLNLNLDSLKDKTVFASLHLPLEAITKQPIRKPEEPSAKPKQSEGPFERLKSSTIEPATEEPRNPSPQNPPLTDSSCEETLVGSSSEENGASERQPLSASTYVKSMLAEAMVERLETAETARDNSPISSESRSDLVKIGSDQTSGHTSGDELETTTSSDIEIISSPNGDSSSAHSRQSPAKLQSSRCADLLTKTLKTRGHSRELSEISIGSDDANLEIERLLRRVREMTEILEARESKLIEVSRNNMELHEQNSSLKKQLDSVEKHVEHNQNITQITDEYTQRLSALEWKFQQAIRERDSLRKGLEQIKLETAKKPSSAEFSNMNAEKDEIIRELRDEGDKLSKQQLQHSNIIKKLRVKEKESDGIIKNQKEHIEEQTVELERLKRSLHAKEEVERSQIDAVHTLTAKYKGQEKEILKLSEQLDHVTNKMEAYKKSFDAAKSELLETKERFADSEKELKVAMESAGESQRRLAQVQDLKIKLRQSEEAHVRKENLLKQENMDLLKRLEAAESRSEELSESVTHATKPLLRQLEQLQSNLSYKTNMYIKLEEMMTEKITDLQSKLETTSETNRSLGEENVNLKSRSSVLESKINAKEGERKKLDELIESMKEENNKLIAENIAHKQSMKMFESSSATEVNELKREIVSLENKLSMEKAAIEAEKRKNHAILEQHSIDEEFRYSPSLSIERDSVSSANSIWPTFNDTMFDSSSGRFPNVYDSFRGGTNSTSMIENLQAQLKQRDGEVQQLQWELSRRNTERDALNNEVSSLVLKVEDLSSSVANMEKVKENLNDIQTKYDALLQMYGEKVEENQELRLDLEDVKEMYKTQIDQLLKRDL